MQIEIPRRLVTRRAPDDVDAPWLSGKATRWMVDDPWLVIIDGEFYEVPAGYVFDAASIPRPLWWITPPTYAPAWEASCFHDICYSHWYGHVTKRFADRAFREIMLKQGANKAVAWAFYQGVRLFGRGGW